MREPELPREAIGAAKRFCRERSEMIHVFRPARSEEGLQKWVGQDTGIEGVFQVVQGLFAAGVLIKGGHVQMVLSS
jgi:hypothetical protein